MNIKIVSWRKINKIIYLGFTEDSQHAAKFIHPQISLQHLNSLFSHVSASTPKAFRYLSAIFHFFCKCKN